jgi:hypothetical protein
MDDRDLLFHMRETNFDLAHILANRILPLPNKAQVFQNDALRLFSRINSIIQSYRRGQEKLIKTRNLPGIPGYALVAINPPLNPGLLIWNWLYFSIALSIITTHIA